MPDRYFGLIRPIPGGDARQEVGVEAASEVVASAEVDLVVSEEVALVGVVPVVAINSELVG